MKLYLIDFSGYIHRAYWAFPAMARSDGAPTNALFGATSMLWSLMRDHRDATHIAAVFDAGRETFRTELYPAYKAHRPPAPDALYAQMPHMQAVAEAFSLPVVRTPGFEADDAIATYAKIAVNAGVEVVIVSADKDLMQLIGLGVEIYDPLKSKWVGPVEVFHKFGVAPNRVVDVQALAGDSADNVPGVPGIGVKTAAELVNRYGDLEAVLAHASEVTRPARRAALMAHANDARLSRELVKLSTEVPVPPLEELVRREPDMGRLQAFLREWEFGSLEAKFMGACVG